MRFADKLPVLRKANNYSQEMLAEKIGVSRQAVSKWESGESYPDMERMLELCKVLNCTLDEIMDDGVLGVNAGGGRTLNFLESFNEFLGFVTKAYNMFCAMKFKQKMKCFFEMLIIAVVLLGVGALVFVLAEVMITRIFNLIPGLWWRINAIIRWLLGVSVTIMGFAIWLHLFKIRYLNYFITVEDQNVSERTMEAPFDRPQSDKVIIRDTKHSSGRFLDVFGKMLLAICKVFVVFLAIPVVMALAGAAFGVGGSLIFWIVYSGVFAFSLLVFAGAGVMAYAVFECLFRFMFARKQTIKRMFIMVSSGIVAIGLGIGLGAAVVATFEMAENVPQVLTKTIAIGEGTVLDGWLLQDVIIDDYVEGAEVEIVHGDVLNVQIRRATGDEFEIYFIAPQSLVVDNWRWWILGYLRESKRPNSESTVVESVRTRMSQESYDRVRAKKERLGM